MSVATSLVSPVVRPVSQNLILPGSSNAFPSSGFLQQGLHPATASGNGLIVGQEPWKGTYRAMQPGKYYSFDGTDDYIAIPSGASPQGQTAWSFAGWIYCDVADALQGIFDSYESGNRNVLIRTNSGGVLQFYVYTSAGQQGGDTGFTLSTGQWYHVACVYDGTDLRTYLNGIISASAPLTLSGAIGESGAGTTQIGRYLTGSNFNGKTSDFRTYNAALTLSEVRELASKGADALPNKATALHYKMEDQHPTLALDSSGNGNDGTKTNIAAAVGNFHIEADDAPHSFENDKGYTSAVYQSASQSSYVSFPGVAGNSDVTVQFDVRPEDDGDFILLGGQSSAYYIAVADNGSVSTNLDSNAGSPTYYVDGVEQSYANRDDVHDSIARGDNTGKWVTVKVRFDASGWTQAQTQHQSAGYELDGWVRNFKVDSNSNGTWDYESALGNDNGFTQNSVSIHNIPRDESDKTKDVFGGTLQYTGKCPRNAKVIESNCATADGTDDYVEVTNSTTIAQSDNAWSLGCLVKAASTSPGWVVTKGTTSNFSWALDQHNGADLRVRLWDTTATTTLEVDAPSVMSTTVFRHIAVTYDETELRVYIDGELAGSSSTLLAGAVKTDGTSVIRAFARGDGSVPFFNASMCDLRIEDGTAWTASQVMEIAQGGDPSGLNYDVWLPMAEGNGDKHYDASGNGHDGDINNHATGTYNAEKQDVLPYNYKYGFSLAENMLGDSNPNNYSGYGTPATITNNLPSWDGTNNAILIEDTDGSGYSGISTSVGPLTAGGCTARVRVKKGTSEGFAVWVLTDQGDLQFTSDVDWVGDTPVIENAGDRHEFIDLGDGWWDCLFPWDTGSNSTVGTFYLIPTNTDSSQTGSCYFAAAQLHDSDIVGKGAQYPYLATSGGGRSLHKRPAMADGSPGTNLYEVSHPAGAYHNLCESKIDFKAGVDFPEKDYSIRDNILPSVDLNSGWSLGNVTAPYSSVESPKGTYDAFRLTENSSTATHEAIESISSSVDQLTISCKARNVDRQYFTLGLQDAGVRALVHFDLQNGTQVDTVETSATIDDYSITPLSDGWYELEVTATRSGSFSQAVLALADSGTLTSGTASYAGDGSSSVDVDCLKVEEWPYATAYIPPTRPTLPRAWEPPVEKVTPDLPTATTSEWVLSNSTVTAGQTDSSGGTTAVLVAGTGGGTNSVYSKLLSLVEGNQYELRCKCKANDSTSLRLRMLQSSSDADASLLFSTGAVTINGSAQSGAYAVDLGSDWFEFVVPFTVTAGETAPRIYIYPNGSNDTTGVYIEDVRLKRAYYNPSFHRQITKNGVLHRVDRQVNYRQILTGARVDAVEQYTATTTV